MKPTTSAMMLALIVGGFSCGGDFTPPEVDPAWAATLVLSREGAPKSGLTKWRVFVNGVHLGEIGFGELGRYHFETIREGNSLKIEDAAGAASDVITFNVDRGQTAAFATSAKSTSAILIKRVSVAALHNKELSLSFTAGGIKRRLAAEKAAKNKTTRQRPDGAGLSGFLAHCLWPVYQQIPALGGWDWLMMIAVVCFFGRVLTLPFRWQSATDPGARLYLLACNTLTMWLCVWFFQTLAGAALLGERVWFDSLLLSETSHFLFLISLLTTIAVCFWGLYLEDKDDEEDRECSVATAHMEAGILLVALIFYWYWSITSLAVFLSCLMATILMDLSRMLFVHLRQRWV